MVGVGYEGGRGNWSVGIGKECPLRMRLSGGEADKSAECLEAVNFSSSSIHFDN